MSLFFESSASMICEKCLSWSGRVMDFLMAIPNLLLNAWTSSIKRLGAPSPQMISAIRGVPGLKFVMDSMEKRISGAFASKQLRWTISFSLWSCFKLRNFPAGIRLFQEVGGSCQSKQKRMAPVKRESSNPSSQMMMSNLF